MVKKPLNVKSKTPVAPQWITIEKEVRRPSFLYSNDAYQVSDERLLALIFQPNRIKNINPRTRTIEVDPYNIWNAQVAGSKKTKSYLSKANMDANIGSMIERLTKIPMIKLDKAKSSALGHKEAYISWCDIISVDRDTATNKLILKVQLSEPFYKIVTMMLNPAGNEYAVTANLDIIQSTQSSYVLRWYYVIADAQKTCSELEVRMTEFLDKIGAKTKLESHWRITDKYIKPIMKALADTNSAFGYEVIKGKTFADHIINFNFKSNAQINLEYQSSEELKGVKYEFESYLSEFGLNSNYITSLKGKIKDNILSDGYINFVISSSVNDLLHKKDNRGKNHPAGWFRSALEKGYYYDSYQGYIKEGVTEFLLPKPMPTVEQLVGQQPEINSDHKQASSKPSFKNTNQALKALFQVVFGSTDGHLLEFILQNTKSQDQLLVELMKYEEPELKDAFLDNAVDLSRQVYKTEISGILKNHFPEFNKLTTKQNLLRSLVSIFLLHGALGETHIASLRSTYINQ